MGQRAGYLSPEQLCLVFYAHVVNNQAYTGYFLYIISMMHERGEHVFRRLKAFVALFSTIKYACEISIVVNN